MKNYVSEAYANGTNVELNGLFHKSTIGTGYWECLDSQRNREILADAHILYYTYYFTNEFGNRISRLRFENWQYDKLASYLRSCI